MDWKKLLQEQIVNCEKVIQNCNFIIFATNETPENKRKAEKLKAEFTDSLSIYQNNLKTLKGEKNNEQ